jgi:predicted sulfurtransferase
VIHTIEQKFGFDNLYNLEGGILLWADDVDVNLEKY